MLLIFWFSHSHRKVSDFNIYILPILCFNQNPSLQYYNRLFLEAISKCPKFHTFYYYLSLQSEPYFNLLSELSFVAYILIGHLNLTWCKIIQAGSTIPIIFLQQTELFSLKETSGSKILLLCFQVQPIILF